VCPRCTELVYDKYLFTALSLMTVKFLKSLKLPLMAQKRGDSRFLCFSCSYGRGVTVCFLFARKAKCLFPRNSCCRKFKLSRDPRVFVLSLSMVYSIVGQSRNHKSTIGQYPANCLGPIIDKWIIGASLITSCSRCMQYQ
jgi:hypothetical protein